MLSRATKKKMQLSTMTRNGITFEKSTLDESRKRFMMQLPKVRFNHLQDVVVRISFSDKQFSVQAAYFIPKMISIIEKALYVRKTQSKKKVAEMSLGTETTARIYAYCLFIHNYLQLARVPINNNFSMVCQHMSKLVRFYLDNNGNISESASSTEEDRTRCRWRYAADWGLHFLSAPVPIVDYAKVPEGTKPQHYVDFVELHESISVTTLWRILSNFAEHLSPNGIQKHMLEPMDEDRAGFIDYLIGETFQENLNLGEGYDYVSELRTKNFDDEQNTLLGKRRDIQREENDEPNIDENGYTYKNEDVVEHARGDIIYNEKDINRMGERIESAERKYTDVLFQMFSAHTNFVKIEDEEMRNKMIQLVFQQSQFPVSDEKLYKVFGMRTMGEVKVEKTHVVDFCILFQFFYFGLTDAFVVYNRIFAEWSARTDARNIFENQMMTLRIIFQKPTMFPLAKQKRTVPKKMGNLFNKLHKLLLIDNEEQGMRTDDCIRAQLMSLAGDFDCVSQELKALIVDCLLHNQDAINIGKGLTIKLLKWVHPTPEMQNKLKAMLLMQSIPLHPETEKQQQIIAEEIYNEKNVAADVHPMELKHIDMFGLDFIDHRFGWVTSDTGAWLKAIQIEHGAGMSMEAPFSEEPPAASEEYRDGAFLAPNQRRFFRATARRAEQQVYSQSGLINEEEEKKRGGEDEMMINTDSRGVRGIYEEFARHEEEMRFRMFEQRSLFAEEYNGREAEDEDYLDQILAEDDRRRMKRFKGARQFMDFEAEEGEENSLDLMFRRDSSHE